MTEPTVNLVKRINTTVGNKVVKIEYICSSLIKGLDLN